MWILCVVGFLQIGWHSLWCCWRFGWEHVLQIHLQLPVQHIAGLGQQLACCNFSISFSQPLQLQSDEHRTFVKDNQSAGYQRLNALRVNIWGANSFDDNGKSVAEIGGMCTKWEAQSLSCRCIESRGTICSIRFQGKLQDECPVYLIKDIHLIGTCASFLQLCCDDFSWGRLLRRMLCQETFFNTLGKLKSSSTVVFTLQTKSLGSF